MYIYFRTKAAVAGVDKNEAGCRWPRVQRWRIRDVSAGAVRNPKKGLISQLLATLDGAEVGSAGEPRGRKRENRRLGGLGWSKDIPTPSIRD